MRIMLAFSVLLMRHNFFIFYLVEIKMGFCLSSVKYELLLIMFTMSVIVR